MSEVTVSGLEIRIDNRLPLAAEPLTGHNRWHPDIPALVRCQPGDVVVLETRDALDGQVRPGATGETVRAVDMSRLHPLTGPVHIEGAQPGDLLEVEILDVEPDTFGYTSQHEGFGFLRDHFPDPFVVTWQLDGGRATSEQLPDVVIPQDAFMGVMGVAPDRELLEAARVREQVVVDAGGLAYPPTNPLGAVPGGIPGREGLRTGPPRENGGNLDIKQTGVGSRIFFPVFVEGALFSTGDAHFAQGDGEVCGAAIEMCGRVTLRFTVHPGRAAAEGIRRTRFTYRERQLDAPREYFATTGLSICEAGIVSAEDTTLAARQALLDMIAHLQTRGIGRREAYALCSVAVDLRISECVNGPNAMVSALLPLDIFE
jgi:formamidase